MKIQAIYDNGGKTLDRYTVITDIHEYDQHHQTDADGLYMALRLSEGGDGFSQWTTAVPGRHLGRRVQFEQLSAKTQAHIAWRLFNG